MPVKLPTLDAVIHAPNRLQICAVLTPLEEAEFQMLRETVGISDSVLSKHIKHHRQSQSTMAPTGT
jgi:hypothetical protein